MMSKQDAAIDYLFGAGCWPIVEGVFILAGAGLVVLAGAAIWAKWFRKDRRWGG